MPEQTARAKWHAPIAQALDCFLERMSDEPEHAAHFAQKAPADPSDLLKRNHRGRNQTFFGRGRVLFLLSHFLREAAPVQETEKAISSRWRAAEAQSTCSKRKIMAGRCFLICGLVAVAA